MKRLLLALTALFYATAALASAPLIISSIQILPQPTGNATVIFTAAGGMPFPGNEYNYILLSQGSPTQRAPVATFVVAPGNYPWLLGDNAGAVILGGINIPASGATSATLTTTAAACDSARGTLGFQLVDPRPGITVQHQLIDNTGAIISEGPLAFPYTLNLTLPTTYPFNYFLNVAVTSGGVQESFSFVFPIVNRIIVSAPLNIGCTDTIFFTVSGGTPPYSACLTPANNPQGCTPTPFTGDRVTFPRPAPGNYVAFVRDSTGCISFSSPLTIPTELSVSAIGVRQPTCQSQGAITFRIDGGTRPYSYCLTPADNPTGCNRFGISGNQVTTDASAGTYVAFVGDFNGCTANSAPVTLNQPSLNVTLGTITQPLCNGESGSVAFTVTGGSVYSACIAPADSPADCTPVPITGSGATLQLAPGEAGMFTVRVVDVSGCEGNSGPFAITQPDSLIVTIDNIISPGCNGGTGSVTFSVTGGTAPYSVCLAAADNPTGCVPTPIEGSTGTLQAPSGSYVVFVVDSSACAGNSSVVTFTEPAALSLNALVMQQVSCNGGNDGQIVAAVCGGAAPYTFFLNGTPVQTSDSNIFIYSDLSAGIPYTVSVNDANNCGPVSQTITLASPGAIAFQVTVGKALCCKDHHLHGLVTVSNITGGTAPFTYSLEGKSRSGCDFIPVNRPSTCVKDGKYLVTVKDANGCTGTQQICVNVR